MDSVLRGNVLFALAAAVLWGGGDFSGGMGVKAGCGGVRAGLRVVLLSHVTSFTVLSAIASLRGDAFPHGAPLAWGIAAGVAGGLSLTGFYIALSRGAMGASAAISGLLAAAIPVAVAMGMSGSPGGRPLIGFAVAGVAIWMIAAEDSPSGVVTERSTMVLATLAGVGFGLYFVALKMASVAGLVWPMATARIGSISTCSVLTVVLWIVSRRRGEAAERVVNRRVALWVLGTALLDTSGNLLFMAATRAGRLDVAAVLASLYPASTILLAALTLREHPTRRQAIGMMTAVVAVVLIAL